MKYLSLVVIFITVCGSAPRVLAANISLTAPPFGAIAVTEVLPNALNESTGEFVEVYNTGANPTDLSTWKLVDASGLAQSLLPFAGTVPTGIRRTLLEPGQVGLILDKDYAGEYDSELLALDSSDSVVLMTTFGGNLSLANTSDGVSVVTEDETVSDSVNWPSDPGSEISLSRQFEVDNSLSDFAPDQRSLGYVKRAAPQPTRPEVVVSEVLPNPDGDEEFIEVYNMGDADVDLSSVKLSDASGQTKLLSGLVSAGGYSTFHKSDTGLALNNDGDVVVLAWTVDDSVLSETSYEDAPAGQSWALIESHFTWTLEVTPGAENVLRTPPDPSEPEPDEVAPNDPNPENDGQDGESQPDVLAIKALAELGDLDDDVIVAVSGKVAAPVGTFYKDSLHLVDQSGGVLVKIPDDVSVPKSDVLSVTGPLDRYSGIARITATSVEVSLEPASVEPLDVSPGDVSKEHGGRLVRLTGTVSSRSGKSFRVSGDEAEDSELVSVRKGSGITAPAPKKGVAVRVTGIVLNSSGKLVVAPRGAADIVDAKGASLYASKTLLKTGAPLADLSRLAAAAAPALWALSNGLRVARAELRRAGRLGRSRSSRGHDVR